MKEPTYRDALSHGWHLMVNHKILWIFGLFSVILGQMGVLEIFTKVMVTIKYYTYYPLFTHASLLYHSFLIALQKWNLPVDQRVWLFWLLGILLALAALFIFVAVVTQGALIHYVAQYINGKTKLASHEGWHAGVKHFWKLLFLQVVKKLGIFLLVLMVGRTTYYFILEPGTLNTILFVFSILLSLLLGSILSLWVTYAAGYIMVEEQKLKNALASSMSLLKSHGLVSLEVAVLMLGVNVLVTMVAIILVLLYKIEIGLVAVIALTTNSLAVWSIGTTFSSLLLTAFLIILGSFVMVYSTVVWMYLFMKMHRQGVIPRLKLLFSRNRA